VEECRTTSSEGSSSARPRPQGPSGPTIR
jgi:hypothetical protein